MSISSSSSAALAVSNGNTSTASTSTAPTATAPTTAPATTHSAAFSNNSSFHNTVSSNTNNSNHSSLSLLHPSHHSSTSSRRRKSFGQYSIEAASNSSNSTSQFSTTVNTSSQTYISKSNAENASQLSNSFPINAAANSTNSSFLSPSSLFSNATPGNGNSLSSTRFAMSVLSPTIPSHSGMLSSNDKVTSSFGRIISPTAPPSSAATQSTTHTRSLRKNMAPVQKTQRDSLFCRYLCLELILMVFDKIDLKSRCRLARVCRHFRNILYSVPEYWRHLDLSRREQRVPRDGLSLDARLMDMTFYSQHVTRNLVSINLSYSSITGTTGLSLLCSRCPEIEKLDLSYCLNIDTFGLTWLVMLKKLKSLSLVGCSQLNDLSISFLPVSAPNLTCLNLRNNSSLTPNCLRDLRALRELEELNIGGCERIDDWLPLLYTGKNTNLRKLILTGLEEEVSDQQVEFLADCYPNLEELSVFFGASESFSGHSLNYLIEKCQRLKKLDLAVSSEVALTNAIPAFRKLEELSLDIGFAGFNSEILYQLATNAPNLISLFFGSNSTDFSASHIINDESLQVLSQFCPKIRLLSINCSELSPLGIRTVSNFSELTDLALTGTKLCNANMKYLAANLPNLERLVLIMPEKLHESAKISYLFRGLSKLKHIGLVLDVFTDKDLQCLGSYCPQLTHIELGTLWNFPMTLMGIAQNCTKLEYLKLAQEKSPPARIRSSTSLLSAFSLLSRNCPHLQRIHIVGSLLTDTSLMMLSAVPSLYSMHLDYCTSITVEGLKAFARDARHLRSLTVVGCLGMEKENALGAMGSGMNGLVISVENGDHEGDNNSDEDEVDDFAPIPSTFPEQVDDQENEHDDE